jgi:endo-1,3-1,4-beta-glycanase ExoK
VTAKIGRIAVFLLAASVTAWAAPRGQSGPACPGWQDTFQTFDTSRWTAVDGGAPGSSSVNTGVYESGNVTLLQPGVLRLTLTQVANGSGVTSYGALIQSKQVCGYGTYSWTMKMSSDSLCWDSSCVGNAWPGSVSAGFIYVNNSQTEIDFEFQGQDPAAIYLVNWLNTNPKLDPTGRAETYTRYTPFSAIDGQHTYSFVWTKSKIAYYIDGKFVVNHTTNVPSAPAYFMINHWGTNSTGWGGTATPGVTRDMYVTSASYTPPAK